MASYFNIKYDYVWYDVMNCDYSIIIRTIAIIITTVIAICVAFEGIVNF